MAGSSSAPRSQLLVVGVLLSGAATAIAIGVYGRLHRPALRPLVLFGFSGVLQMKTWLATAALVLVVVQLLTALGMWARLPGVRSGARWIATAHRWSGSAAFVVSLPVALHCLWSLGFQTASARVAIHGVAGCAFYGAYAAKMIGLRVPRGPKWLLPVLGGTAFSLFVVVWLTSALWFFTRSGLALT